MLRDIAVRLPHDLMSAFALLSRLPLPNHRGTGAASAWAWPLVGAVLGAIGAALAAGAQWLGVTPGVTAALVLALGAIWSALTALLVHGGYVPALIAAGALSRAPMALIMALLPNARGEGLSHATGRPSPATALVGLALAVILAGVLTGWGAVPLVFAALGVTLWLALTALRRIGGQTGDILGASQQLAEVACLAVLSARAW